MYFIFIQVDRDGGKDMGEWGENKRILPCLKKLVDWKQKGDPLPDEDEMDKYMYFLDKYTSLLVGVRELNDYFKKQPGKTLLNKLTSSDIAYSILVYENSVDVWKEEARLMKENPGGRRKETLRSNELTAKVRYHWPRGKRIPFGWDGWTAKGKEYYEDLKKEQEQVLANMRDYLDGQWIRYAGGVGNKKVVARDMADPDFVPDWNPNNVGEIMIPENWEESGE
jgi:hypothetical protein